MIIRQPLVRRGPRPAFPVAKILPTGPSSHWDSLAAQQIALDHAVSNGGGTLWYNYSGTKAGLVSPVGSRFQPMVSTLAEVTAPGALKTIAENAGVNGVFMFLNEPNDGTCSVADAITGWDIIINDPYILAYNISLWSPAPVDTGGPSGTSLWFSDWWAGIGALSKVRYPDVICRHNYNDSDAAILNNLALYRGVYQGFQFALTEFGTTTNLGVAAIEAQMRNLYRNIVGSTFFNAMGFFELGYFLSQTWRNMYNTDGSPTAIGTYWNSLSIANLKAGIV